MRSTEWGTVIINTTLRPRIVQSFMTDDCAHVNSWGYGEEKMLKGKSGKSDDGVNDGCFDSCFFVARPVLACLVVVPSTSAYYLLARR